MKTTHTPGPWKVENDNRADYMLTIRSESARLGIAYSCKDDARLIAAAPDLLAALQEARAFIATVTTHEASMVLERTWAAVAKAEGNA